MKLIRDKLIEFTELTKLKGLTGRFRHPPEADEAIS